MPDFNTFGCGNNKCDKRYTCNKYVNESGYYQIIKNLDDICIDYEYFEDLKDKHDMFVEKLFYDYEIDLLKKMCAVCMISSNFTEEEKIMIESILDNTLQ